MKLNVNGEITIVNSLTKTQSVSKTITQLGFNPKLVVLELNGKIISPNRWEDFVIKENDNLEIVTIVGGGS